MGKWPSTYSCKLMEPGIISYEDSGAGIALIKKETIDRISVSLVGKPVVVRHQKVTPENHEKISVGYVTAVRFNAQDGWHYVDFLITSDDVEPIERDNGMVVFKATDGEILDGVSGAYDVINHSEGGVWHDIKFDAEILDGSFTHLALVVNPRYEETNKIQNRMPMMLVNGKVARNMENSKVDPKFNSKDLKIVEDGGKFCVYDGSREVVKKNTRAQAQAYIDDVKDEEEFDAKDSKKNSKQGGSMNNIFKLVKDVIKTVVNGKEEEATEKMVDVDGTEVPLKDLIIDYQAEQKEKEEKEKLEEENAKGKELRMAKDEDEVDIDGKKVKVSELKACHAAKGKKNAKDEDKDKEDKEKADKEAKNAKDEEDKKAKEEEEKKQKAENEKKEADEKEKKDKEEKENAKKLALENSKSGEHFFNTLENASKSFVADKQEGAPRSREQGAKVGRQRYGSENKNKQ